MARVVKTEDPLMTAQEVADLLNLHVKTLRLEWRTLGLPGMYVGRRLRFPAEGIQRWLNQGMREAA